MDSLNLHPIKEVENLSEKDFINQYFIPQKPVLIKGFTKSWPAYIKWNIDYIQNLAGDQEVRLYNNKPTEGKQKSAEPVTTMKLYDYLEIIKHQPSDLRIFFYNVLEKMPVLQKDFHYPELGLKFFKKLPVMFFGSTGSKVLSHFDMDLSHLFHFHFHGQKEIWLFSPSQTPYIYKVPFSVHNLESIDMENPDFQKYPALKKINGIKVKMNHGDALFMPSGWWHYVKYLNGGFSLTLRSFNKKPRVFFRMLYNVFFMRHFENIMRKLKGQKWVDYKNEYTLKKTNKRYDTSQKK